MQTRFKSRDYPYTNHRQSKEIIDVSLHAIPAFPDHTAVNTGQGLADGWQKKWIVKKSAELLTTPA